MGGTVEIVYINGEKFTPNMAYWFNRMADAFFRDTGYYLLPSSALRFGWEQEAIFRERYVPASQVNGRYVYDWRTWNGVLWGRISSAGTVAVPTTSNHEFESTGFGAVDVYDSGPDAGVSIRGTIRDRWMEQHAHEYYFENEGYQFAEAWHKKFVGGLYDPAPAGGGGQPFPDPTEPDENEFYQEDDDMPNYTIHQRSVTENGEPTNPLDVTLGHQDFGKDLPFYDPNDFLDTTRLLVTFEDGTVLREFRGGLITNNAGTYADWRMAYGRNKPANVDSKPDPDVYVRLQITLSRTASLAHGKSMPATDGKPTTEPTEPPKA